MSDELHRLRAENEKLKQVALQAQQMAKEILAANELLRQQSTELKGLMADAIRVDNERLRARVAELENALTLIVHDGDRTARDIAYAALAKAGEGK